MQNFSRIFLLPFSCFFFSPLFLFGKKKINKVLSCFTTIFHILTLLVSTPLPFSFVFFARTVFETFLRAKFLLVFSAIWFRKFNNIQEEEGKEKTESETANHTIFLFSLSYISNNYIYIFIFLLPSLRNLSTFDSINYIIYSLLTKYILYIPSN